MPLIKTYYPVKIAVIGVWYITETLVELENLIKLSAADQLVYDAFNVEKRKKEWLCVRILLKALKKEDINIFYDDNHRPFLKATLFNISISHSKNYVAVYLDHKKNLGIDIEEPRTQILKITNKFLSPMELAFISGVNKIMVCTMLWCVKETLYKFYGKKLLDFKTELAVEPFELNTNGKIWALIIKENYKKLLSVKYICESGYILTYVGGN